MTRCCVQANSLSGAIECEKFPGYLVNCRFSKRYPIVVSFLLYYLVTLPLIYRVIYLLCYLFFT